MDLSLRTMLEGLFEAHYYFYKLIMDKTFFSSNLNRGLATLALIGLVVALGAYAYYTMQQSKYLYTGPTTISVMGEGEAVGVPDIGKFTFSVTESGKEAAAAQEASATKINSIIAALKEAGVEEKDIKTEYYNMYPKYKYEQAPCPYGSYCPGEQVQDGFEVTQTIAVKVRQLDKSGALLALAGDKGATNISSLEFTIDDPQTLKEQARSKAIANAKEKAKVLAKELDVRLIKMVGYYEDEGVVSPYAYGMGGDMMMKAESASFEAPQLPTGENTTNSKVTITYQVK
jgi:uncharacterized protein